MMSPAYGAIAAAYTAFFIAFAAIEFWRTRHSGPDAITIFMAIFLLQCCLPGIGIYGALPLADAGAPTGNFVFDGIFNRLNYMTALLVLTLTIWFGAFVYLGACWGGKLLYRLFPGPPGARYIIEGVKYRFVAILAAGLALTLFSFFLLGDDLVDRFTNLIRLRAYSDEVVSTDLNSYAFALTQAWGWLSIPALFLISERRRRGLIWFMFLGCTIVFAILGASRRALFIPIMLIYFTLLVYDGRWRVRLVLALVVPVVAWVMYGKEILAAVAFGGAFEDVFGRYESTASAILRSSSEQGITIVESLGTITFLDDYFRFGVDHLLSIAQKFPHRLLDIDVDYPKRMVRISTEAFSDASTQDIPPGLLGQMWLDFRVLGPVLWGVFIGVQLSVVQLLKARWKRSLQSSALVALLVFLIALPINTGSYDFTINVDVLVTLLSLAFVYRVRRISIDSVSAARV
jgi:hypothetical protein